jgi:flagellar export protein FliJ
MYFNTDGGNDMRISHHPKFRTVLKVRKIQERKAQAELNQLQKAQAEEEAALEDKKETQKTAVSDAVRNMKMKATEAQTNRAFLRKLSREIDEQTKKVTDLQTLEQDKRDEVVERTKSTAMIEKLDDKLHAEAEKENERKEQRLIDVLAQRMKADNS